MPEAEYLTQEKFNELKKELEHLKTDRRKEIATSLEYAKSLGDLSENSEYHEAREAQGALEDRINRLEHILKTAVIVEGNNKGAVSVGSTITIEKVGEKGQKVYTIVGSEEADATSGKISMKSPLGVAAMGKKKGDKFNFNTPAGEMNYKIIDIK